MGLARTNITLPEETLALIDEVAGPRGRSRYIADVVTRQVRRDHAREVFRTYAGALKDSTTWGRTDEEVDAYFRRLRAEWDRPWIWEDSDAVPAGRESADRPQSRAGGRCRADRAPVRPG
ncbi:MAG: hypothetical protein WEC14_01215 [Chloroflexota bacterium]